MTPLIPAFGGALVVLGILGVIAGLRERPVRTPAPVRHRLPTIRVPKRTRWLLAAGLVLGVTAALLTGWLLAVVVIPVAAIGLPVLLSSGGETEQIRRLEAMEEWIRGLSGVLTSGVGLEQALIATLRSTPDAIRPEVGRLVARLRARWSTEAALRAFADDLDDATGDLIAANLILGAKRRGPGLASVLETLAESVSGDVRARRQVEADRAKPRTTARWVTIITIGVLAVLAFTGTYVDPYKSPFGQLLLSVLLGAYAAVLIWMRRMAAGKPLPRFIGVAAREEASR